MEEVGACASVSSNGCAVGAIVSNTRLSTAATTLGIAGETFLNSSARARNDASLVGNSMFPEINVKERVQCNSIIEVYSPLRT